MDNISVTSGDNFQIAISVAVISAVILFMYKLRKKKKKSFVHMEVENAFESENVLQFKDIAGNLEAKESVEDIVDFIKNPEKYSSYGARMPRGIIFYGPPGTGKTIMAKAIAGEAEVPFYAVNGSDFIQMYVGVGASRIRELFKKARKSGKSVIFIDEIDAIGKKRGGSSTGSSDERDQTLNALLTEMSGFCSDEGVIVIAATNRLDTLDEALLRPGRFDRHVEISLPDVNARKSILNLYAKDKPLCEKVKIEDFAKKTVYFSGAMLENFLNEAAILAAKKESEKIQLEDMEKAYYTIIAGSEKIDRTTLKEFDRKITAFHEAGHALVTKLRLPENIVSKVTIMPSSKGIGGVCINIPPDKMFYTKKELQSQIMVMLAGRISEEIIFGEDNITTGASNDIEKAVAIVKDYVIKYGMGKGLKFAAATDESIILECANLVDELYSETKELLNDNISILTEIANSLIEKESLNEEELNLILSI